MKKLIFVVILLLAGAVALYKADIKPEPREVTKEVAREASAPK